MNKRTWTYGIVKSVTVLEINGPVLVAHEKETDEGFILTGITIPSGLEAGDTLDIEFKEGGSTGGYWDIVKEE